MNDLRNSPTVIMMHHPFDNDDSCYLNVKVRVKFHLPFTVWFVANHAYNKLVREITFRLVKLGIFVATTCKVSHEKLPRMITLDL